VIRYDAQVLKPILLGVGLPVAGALFISLIVRTGNVSAESSASALTASADSAYTTLPHNDSLLDLSSLKCQVALEAAKRASQLMSRDAGEPCTAKNPFFYQENTAASPIDPTSLIPMSDPDAPLMQLTGVMQGRTSLAIINGNTYTVGETIIDGWILKKIDTDQRSVVITGPLGKELTLSAEDKFQFGGG